MTSREKEAPHEKRLVIELDRGHHVETTLPPTSSRGGRGKEVIVYGG